MADSARTRFEPYAVLKTLDRHRVTYIVIGAFARVIQGSEELNSQRDDGRELRFDEHSLEPVIPLRTDAGELKIVPEPEGTRGYDDLRRAATASRSAWESVHRSPRWVTWRACSERGDARSTSRTCESSGV
jgi:hypothetical protein